MGRSWWDASHTHIHSWDDQRIRQSRAVHIYVEPELFDHGSLSADINGFYVTLDHCECPDFEKRRFPCKHMYRLAHEYGFFDLGSHIVAAQQVISTLPSYLQPVRPNQPRHLTSVDSVARSHRHTALALALLLGGLGAHLFYQRKPILGILSILSFPFCISVIIAPIVAIIYASTSDAAWRANNMPGGSSYGRDLPGMFLPKWNSMSADNKLTANLIGWCGVALVGCIEILWFLARLSK